jgi:RNA polymerase-binding transcription factor DksA
LQSSVLLLFNDQLELPNVVAFDINVLANTILNIITEVLGMKVFEKKLYEELRDQELEMRGKLDKNLIDEKIRAIVEDELKDIVDTLNKLECGEYGICEMSGELIPFDLLSAIPTAKFMDDFEAVKGYYRKPHAYN